jgi:hypothetical protein
LNTSLFELSFLMVFFFLLTVMEGEIKFGFFLMLHVLVHVIYSIYFYIFLVGF